MRSYAKRGFTLIELLVVIAIIAILASILFPVFAKAREKARQTTCLSQVRQIATAIQMYTQDNSGRYPPAIWTTGVGTYLGGATKMFFCPSDAVNDSQQVCSYGMNGSLIRLDGTGVNEAQINSPVDVGVLCDANPSRAIGQDTLIPGGGLQADASNSGVPNARHSKGIVVGFCDGHAKYVPTDFTPADCGNAVIKGFYECIALNLVNNPGGGLPLSTAFPSSNFAFPMPSSSAASNAFAIGGEYCTAPLVTALAELWKVKGSAGNASLDYQTKPGFLGEYYTSRSFQLPSSFLWGSALGGGASVDTAVTNCPGFGASGGGATNETGTAIAHDALVCIVSKNTKIQNIPAGTVANSITVPAGGLGLTTVTNNSSPSNGWYVCNTATIACWFTANTGYSANQWQAYTYSTMTSTLYTFYNYLNIPIPTVSSNLTAQAITCTNDNDMVDKVANDPYGIGYCSSVFVDLDRVQVLGMVDATCATGQCYWPNANGKYKTWLPNPYPGGGPNNGQSSGTYLWPASLMRTLAVYGGGDGNLCLIGTTWANLDNGPMFACSYW
jgi:prepilin-type N-terminal cleavage/methylation domain-containing protein/prepilin-type processing-associated H-X9-DG protein